MLVGQCSCEGKTANQNSNPNPTLTLPEPLTWNPNPNPGAWSYAWSSPVKSVLNCSYFFYLFLPFHLPDTAEGPKNAQCHMTTGRGPAGGRSNMVNQPERDTSLLLPRSLSFKDGSLSSVRPPPEEAVVPAKRRGRWPSFFLAF